MLVGTPIPNAATPVHDDSGNVANAVATCVLPATAARINYVSAIQFMCGGSTAATVVSGTLTGIIGGPFNFIVGAPAGAGILAQPFDVTFNPALSATGSNVSLTWSVPALGAGNTNAVAAIYGYLL